MTTDLQIQLEDLRQPAWQPLYVGNRARFATATAVRFLDAHTLVCASLLARRIYLIHFDLAADRYSVADSTRTSYGGSSTEVDLCDTDGQSRLITSNCEGGGMSLYRIAGDTIRHDRDLVTGLPGNYCHGARFCGPDVAVATALRGPRGAHFYDVHTMRKILYVRTDLLPKDICFLPGGRAVLVTTEGAPLPGASDTRNTSELLLVEYDLRRGTSGVVTRQRCEARQLDSAAHSAGHLYVVDSHGGRILVVEASTLRPVDTLEGYDFPHGVDVQFGMLAVACYGTNSIHVRSIKH